MIAGAIYTKDKMVVVANDERTQFVAGKARDAGNVVVNKGKEGFKVMQKSAADGSL